MRAELLKGVPSQNWQDTQIENGAATEFFEDIVRRNTFEDEDTKPGKRNRQFRASSGPAISRTSNPGKYSAPKDFGKALIFCSAILKGFVVGRGDARSRT